MSGIDCGGDCEETYPDGVKVTLAAMPNIGYLFDGWGGACSGDGECTVSMSQDQNVSASFVPDNLTCEDAPVVLISTNYASTSSSISIETDGMVELLETDSVEYRAPVIRFLPGFLAPPPVSAACGPMRWRWIVGPGSELTTQEK